MFQDEEEENVTLTYQFYWEYYKLAGGWISFLAINLTLTGLISCKIYNDYLYGEWIESLNDS